MADTRDKKLELISQLLAKAESTTPEEAEALTEHAERLMVKYGIEQAMVNDRRAKEGKASEEIIQGFLDFTGAYRLEMIHLGSAVVRALGNMRVLQSTYKNKWARLYIIGFEGDVNQAKTLIQSLQVQSAVAMRSWWRTVKADYAGYRPYDQEAARRSFVRGFGTGAGKRIMDSRAAIVEEQGSGAELVLASRDAKVQEYYDQIETRSVKPRSRKGDISANGHGFRAGQNANTGEKAMTQGRGISA